jgi:hypothetical protein
MYYRPSGGEGFSFYSNQAREVHIRKKGIE